jgi:uncharacterized repeat protein (TIGR04076 family)
MDGTDCPEGFCNWAYADFQKHLVRLYLSEENLKDRKSYYLACTDGKKPVIFKLERIES